LFWKNIVLLKARVANAAHARRLIDL